MTVDDTMDHRRLRLLERTDPAEAVVIARALLSSGELPVHEVAGVLVDAGEDTGDRAAVLEGLTALKAEAERAPDPNLEYLIGTAYTSLAKTDPTSGLDWYENTRDIRRHARRHLATAATTEVTDIVREMAWINLGNDLTHAGRFDESYACFLKALPNPVAAGWVAEALFKAAHARLGDPETLIPLAHRYAQQAQAQLELVEAITGPAVVELFASYPTKLADSEVEPTPELSNEEQFVRDHRLYLSTAIDGAHPQGWDYLHVPGLTVPVDAAREAPPLFTMLNLFKADLRLARRLLIESLTDNAADGHLYTDTLDYTSYGERTAKLSFALRSALDVLDRVAVAANHYFDIGLRPERVDFRTLWRDDRNAGVLRGTVRTEIEANNWSVLALVELADDIAHDGWLADRRSLRNVATHRFLAIHDLIVGAHQECDEIVHVDFDHAQAMAVSAIAMARAGTIYLVDAVSRREHRLHHQTGGVNIPLHLPTHADIRGK